MSPNLTTRLVEVIGERIRQGELRPGDRLPTERTLMVDHGVSRTVVREAISRLQEAGLVETQQGSGSYVLARPSAVEFSVESGAVRSTDDLLELLAFRMGIEVEAAGLAAHHRTDRQVIGLHEALDRLLASADRPSAAVDADFQFHLRLAIASGNRYYADVITTLGPTMIAMPSNRLGPVAAGRLDRVGAEHDNILTAVAAGDAEGARAAVRVHLGNSQHRVRQRPD